MDSASDPYLGGLHAPVRREVTADRLRVRGTLPPDLDGTFLQVGSNPRFAPRGAYHWFDGDGMVHGVTLHEGRASYRNRWVRTQGFERETAAGRALSSGILESIDVTRSDGSLKDTANTDLVMHRGRLLALWWIGGRAHRLDPCDLRTLGVEDFGGALPRRIAAHPKVDPVSQSLVFLDWHPLPPWLCVGEIDRDGALSRYGEVALPGPRLQHDLAITPRYAVVLDAPLLLNERALASGHFELEFHRELPLRLGLVPRHGREPMRWFDAEPGYVFHLVNAWEEEHAVIVQGCRIADPLVAEPPASRADLRAPRLGGIRMAPRLHRWHLDLRDGSLREAVLDDRLTEFPRTDDAELGAHAHFSIHPRIADRPTLLFDGLIRFDAASRSVWHAHPRHCFGGEACLVRDPARVHDGWLLVYVTDERSGRSELHVLDSAQLGAPVARIELPQRVPAGFHTRWVPAGPRPDASRAAARSQGSLAARRAG